EMRGLLEAARRFGADTQGRGVGCLELRVRTLQLPQFAEQSVVLWVGKGRLVEDVVLVIGAFQDRTQLCRALFQARVRRWGHGLVGSVEARTIWSRPPCLAAYHASSARLIRRSG